MTQKNSAILLSLSPIPFARMVAAFQIANPLKDLELTIVDGNLLSEAEISAQAPNTTAILADYSGNRIVSENLINALPELKFIQTVSVGYQHIDAAACVAAGVMLANTEGANSTSVAEHAIMAALCLLKEAVRAHRTTYEGRWLQMEIASHDLSGHTWGIIGMGNSGKAVAERLVPFGVTTIYHSRSGLAENEESRLQATRVDLGTLLRQADIISLHCPLTEETQNLIDGSALTQMKDGAILLNVARGGVVDEQELAKAIASGKLRGASLDVYGTEPIAATNPILKIDSDRLLLSPHIAGATTEAKQRILSMALANVARFFSGEKPQHLVVSCR